LRVRGSDGFPAAPPEQDRFTDMERRMEKLMSMLEKAESAATRSSDGPSRPYRWKGQGALDKRQQSMLKNILENNLELQALQNKT